MKLQLLFVVLSILISFGLYQLPRVVVENDVVTDAQQLAEPDSLSGGGHAIEITDEMAEIVSSLQEKLNTEGNPKNLVNFADSLSRMYLSFNQLDSAYKYAQKIFEIDSEEFGRLKSGLLIYDIFELTTDQGKAVALGQKAREFLEPIANSTQDESLLVKVGMTYVSTQNPMQGILMIRDVLEKNPKNTEAMFKLGFLAIKSGQLERAVGRFEQILKIDPENWNAILYLGISHAELGEVNKAKKQLDRIIEESNVPVLIQIANDYLKEIS